MGSSRRFANLPSKSWRRVWNRLHFSEPWRASHNESGGDIRLDAHQISSISDRRVARCSFCQRSSVCQGFDMAAFIRRISWQIRQPLRTYVLFLLAGTLVCALFRLTSLILAGSRAIRLSSRSQRRRSALVATSDLNSRRTRTTSGSWTPRLVNARNSSSRLCIRHQKQTRSESKIIFEKFPSYPFLSSVLHLALLPRPCYGLSSSSLVRFFFSSGRSMRCRAENPSQANTRHTS